MPTIQCRSDQAPPKRPRVPYGLTKWIVARMRVLDVIYVRPEYIIQFRQTARQLGIRVVSNTIRRDGRTLWRLKRVLDGRHPSGHKRQRMPTRDGAGRFLADPI